MIGIEKSFRCRRHLCALNNIRVKRIYVFIFAIGIISKTVYSHMAKKHSSFTLLEVVIATVLLQIILFVLFSSYTHIWKNHFQATALRQKMHQIQVCDHRLHSLFSCLSPLDQKTALWLQHHSAAQGPALMLHFQQPIDRDPHFCGTHMGMIFLDHDKHLSFARWGDKNTIRLEKFLADVPTLHWSFFDAAQGDWVEEWPKKKGALPKMIRVKLGSGKYPLTFVYFLDNVQEAEYTEHEYQHPL